MTSVMPNVEGASLTSQSVVSARSATVESVTLSYPALSQIKAVWMTLVSLVQRLSESARPSVTALTPSRCQSAVLSQSAFARCAVTESSWTQRAVMTET